MSLAVAAGIMFAICCVAFTLYWLRASRQGRAVGPAGAYRQRQWARASSGVVSSSVAVHMPKRGGYGGGGAGYPQQAVRVRVQP